MFEHIADFTAWPILTGIFIGYIANRIMSGEGKGCCMNLFIGIVGSYVGTFISYLLNIDLFGRGYLANFVFCVLGSISILWIWKKLFGQKMASLKAFGVKSLTMDITSEESINKAVATVITADGRNDGWQTTLVMALMERSKT